MASTFYLNRDEDSPVAVKADENIVKIFENIDAVDTSTLEEGEIVATIDDKNLTYLAGIWQGTIEEYESIKDSIPDGTICFIIDGSI